MNNNLSSIFNRIKEHRLLYNLALMGLIILGMALAAHFIMQLGTRHGARRTVPDLSGIGLDEARKIARANDLDLHINDSLFVPTYEGGIVLAQLPEGGVEVKPGRMIYITINSFREKMVPVPYVAGRSLRQAKNMLEIAGLEIERLVYRPDIATNYVLEEYCHNKPVLASSRVEAEVGSGVTLHVGVEEGESSTATPFLVGLPLKEAKGRLWESGLNIGKLHFDEGINMLNQKDARVYAQDPVARHYTSLGDEVDLRLTLNEKKISRESKSAQEAAQVLAKEQQREQERLDSLENLQLKALLSESTPAEGEHPAQDNNNSEFFD